MANNAKFARFMKIIYQCWYIWAASQDALRQQQKFIGSFNFNICALIKKVVRITNRYLQYDLAEYVSLKNRG